ncbi:MAG: hypothetical protein IJF33_08155 [Clostridia bacterium]|nr:hypothetical protein [Clostridia bacterium]
MEPAYEYFYDNAGNLALVRDHDRGTETRYVYDLADRLVCVEDSAGLTVTYEYDDADPKLGFHKRVKLSASLTTKHKSAEEFPRRFCV